MVHFTDVEKQLNDERTATGLHPSPAPSIERVRPAHEPSVLHPDRQPREEPATRPIWHKDNFGFWLGVCVVISLVFSIVYRSLG